MLIVTDLELRSLGEVVPRRLNGHQGEMIKYEF